MQGRKYAADRRHYRPWHPRRSGGGPRRPSSQPREGGLRGDENSGEGGRVPKGEETNTLEEAHHAADHTGGVTTAVHHATTRTEMAKNNRMLKGYRPKQRPAVTASWSSSLLPSILPTKAFLQQTAGSRRW